MHNRIRPYAWGSRTAIAELLGAPSPSPHPQAELWVGAHPADPSALLGGPAEGPDGLGRPGSAALHLPSSGGRTAWSERESGSWS